MLTTWWELALYVLVIGLASYWGVRLADRVERRAGYGAITPARRQKTLAELHADERKFFVRTYPDRPDLLERLEKAQSMERAARLAERSPFGFTRVDL